ncbi:hypothetical protein [Nostoc sp. TCL240-02]|uniref:hypothetical protein n=1 Tax=Nostoc sp. TCL240-02 TaxID=2572090 RepID=UPI00157F8A8A|nr:hypothetical protein [Nostoc sp. TCL240-02]QKQ76151.1 hypothetical protein FBB35_25275 [Nostoc sp. TCL240-02]
MKLAITYGGRLRHRKVFSGLFPYTEKKRSKEHLFERTQYQLCVFLPNANMQIFDLRYIFY